MTDIEFKHKVLSLSPRVYPMAVRFLRNEEEAQDAVQEIMIKLWNKRKQLLRHPNVNGFVFLTARNYCLDLLKKNKRVQIDRIDRELNADIYEEPEQEDLKDAFGIIRKIINELPENQKEVMLMRDIDGLEFEEIAAATGFTKEHIRVLLSRARKNVRVHYEKKHNYEQGTS